MSRIRKDFSLKKKPQERPSVVRRPQDTEEEKKSRKAKEVEKAKEVKKVDELEQSEKSKDLEEFEEPLITTKRFVERKSNVEDITAYPRNRAEPGLVIIMNQTFVDKKGQRDGTEHDVSELVTLFGRLGYNIDKELVRNDLSRKEILALLDKVLADPDKTNCNCLIFAFLTHGDQNNVLQLSDDSAISVNDLWEKIDQCQNLRDKPKLFLIQACKGEEETQVDQTFSKTSLVPTSVFNNTPPDMLTVFATREGTVSRRETGSGSWFVQEFCKNAFAYARTEDVVSIVLRTTKCVANTYYDIEDDNVYKQIPTSVLTLNRKFYLTTSKHRNALLEELRTKDEIIAKLSKVRERSQRIEKSNRGRPLK